LKKKFYLLENTAIFTAFGKLNTKQLIFFQKIVNNNIDNLFIWEYYKEKILLSRYTRKQVSLKTDLKRAADGEIAAVMLKLNGSWKVGDEHK
jgi:hypothetical protein